MRTRKRLVLALLLAVTVAGCGTADDGEGVATAGGGKATSSATADKLSDKEQLLKFAKCMRENGVPDFPDPKFQDGGGVSIDVPEGTDPKKVDAANEKCKKYLPNGGEPGKADPEVMKALRAYAKCMRANGVPKFPDPTDRGLQISEETVGMPPHDPRFKAAEEKCRKHMPKGPGGRLERRGG